MSVPIPPIELEGHCSTIYDNTLYVLSPGGFQSLPLKKHAKWAKEPSGVAVTGPACVTTFPNGPDSQPELWVLGGTSSDTSFSGVQVFSFADRSWQTVHPTVPVMQGRTNHSAAYLEDLQSVVVYAGAQPDAPTALSSETFVLSTQAPYGIQAFISNDAPTANLPILQAWDTGSVVMVGGSVLNTQISIFSPQGGWQFLSNGLVTPLNPSARGTLIQGGDGSKVLEVYDANVSPNDVFQVVLLGAGGAAAFTGETVGSNSSSKLRKRDLTLSDWPAYNSKNAPAAVRSDFSVSQSTNGVAVLAGGNSKQPVAIFNQDQNSWVNADQFFDSQNHQHPLKPTKSKSTSSQSSTTSHTATSSTSSTSSSTSTLTPASSHGSSSHNDTLRTLGIILGVLFGIAAVFIAILLYLRWRKMKKRKQQGWLDEKDAQHMSFQDRGTPSFLRETGNPANGVTALPNAPYRQSRNESSNSLGIIAGKFNKRLSNKRMTNGRVQQGSFDSTTRLVKGPIGAVPTNEPVELADIEKPPLMRMTPRAERSDRPPTGDYGPTAVAGPAEGRSNRNRSSGWSKYFATSSPAGPNGISHLPSAYVKTAMMSDGSMYSTDRAVPQQGSTLSPQTVDGQPLSKVASRSPLINDSREDLARRGSFSATEGQKGLIVNPNRPRSQSESLSSYTHSARSSARTSEYYNDNVQAIWSPSNPSGREQTRGQPYSNPYDTERRVPSRGKSSHFFPGPGDGVAYRPQRNAKPKSIVSSNTQESEDRDSSMTSWPKFVPSAHYSKPMEEQLATADSDWPVPPRGRGVPADSRDSNMTTFSKAAPSSQALSSDLGWLNLGLNGSQHRP